MTDKKTTETASAFKTDAENPMLAMFGMMRKEMLKVSDEAEKMMERSLVEAKRASHESGRLWESQIELSSSVARAMFDGARRMWSV